jgi:photosystem II stability/assembly factor-like uncharacterized protein
MKRLLGTIALLILATAPALGQYTAGLHVAVLESRVYVVGADNAPSGVYRLEADGAWTHLGWRNIRAFGLDVSQGRSGHVLLSAGNGAFVSSDGGSSWRQTTDWQVTEVMEIAADPHRPGRLFIATAYGLWRSEDGAGSWAQMHLHDRWPAFAQSIAVDWQTPGHVIAGTEGGIYRSTDGGDSWEQVVDGPAIRRVRQSGSEPGLWIAGADGHGVLLSRDGGRTWTNAAAEGAPSASIFAVAANHADAGRMAAAGFETGVHLSRDAGSSWRHVEAPAGQSIRSLAFDPQTRDRLWAGTIGGGLFYTDDEGATWHHAGLDGSYVWDIVFSGEKR